MKIIKIEEKELPVPYGNDCGYVYKQELIYLLFFDNNRSIIVNDLFCYGQPLHVGDEVFLYGYIISRRPLSKKEIKKRNVFDTAPYIITLLICFIASILVLFLT